MIAKISMAQILWEPFTSFKKNDSCSYTLPTISLRSRNHPPIQLTHPWKEFLWFGPATPAKQWYNSKESSRDAHNTWLQFHANVRYRDVFMGIHPFFVHRELVKNKVVGQPACIWPFRGEQFSSLFPAGWMESSFVWTVNLALAPMLGS